MPGTGPRRRRGRILVYLLALLFAVGVVPLLWTSFKLVSTSRESLEFNQKATQLDMARSLSQQTAIYVESLRAQVAAIARTMEVDGGMIPFPTRLAHIRDQKALERYLGENTGFNSVSVVDRAGQGPQSGVQLQEPAIQEALREGFYRGLQGTSMTGQPIISSSLQEPVLVITEPVKYGGAVQGVVLAVASLLPIWRMTEQTGEQLFAVYVVDGRGHIIAHSDRSVGLGTDMSNIEIVREFLESKGVAATRPFAIPAPGGAIKMLGTYTRVNDDSGWGVIVQVEESKAYFTAFDMRRKSLALVAVVTVLAIVLGVTFAGQISRPIQQLAQGARRLAGGDYATRVSIKSENEVGLLADAFNQMGDEIQKSIEEIQRAATTNKELFMGSIRMLANAIDEKDPYTRGHSERVAYYSMITAKHLGMTPEEVERVHLSGIIHDVGKIGIEDKILRKAAALTEDEYEMMKQHPTKGAHILEAVPLLKEMAGAGLMHHENVDGSGYPDGLKGEDIPLLGRIVSVADAFDAMTTDRPYSKAMTFEAALARLRFLAGKKFDLACVEAFERAAAAGELTPAKARRASVAARQADAAQTPAAPAAEPASSVPTA
ncbi:MAG TPA: HD domain-containing phosphohydrolase [Vicinamibacteria bacterium]|nr:HD domain-containing phosphohydrolase [Vicinamibacteria bacterium]